jgi:hypothetical protein
MGLWDEDFQEARNSAAWQEAKRLCGELRNGPSVPALERALAALDAALREFPVLSDDEEFRGLRNACREAARALRGSAEWAQFAAAHGEFVASLNGPEEGWARCELVSSGWGFRFRYPAAWRLQRDDEDGRAMVSPSSGAAENFNVIMKSLPYVSSIEQHAATSIEKLRYDVPGVTILERHFRQLGKSDAYELLFAAESGGARVKGKQIYALDGNVAYTLTALAPEEKHGDLLPLFDGIIASFESVSRGG